MPPPDSKPTPAMAQYARFKQRHPDCVLFFRMGDFYEMFNEDAVTVSRVLGLTLTQRSPGQPMAGVPHHQLEVYLRRALEAGLRVAVCEQVENPKEAKGVVARAVTRVCTPGTLVEEGLLAESAPSVLAAVMVEIEWASAACVELSTGSFVILDCPAQGLADALARRGVKELLYPEDTDGARPAWTTALGDALGAALTPRASWHFRSAESGELLRQHYGVATMQGFGLRDDDSALRPAGALLRYLHETQVADERDLPADARARYRGSLGHVRPPKREACGGTLVLDAVSLRSLEIERTLRSGGAGGGPGGPSGGDGSLLGVMLSGPGGCRTPMGKRMLREWLCAPSAELTEIHARQSGVAALFEDRRLAREVGEALTGVQDVARIAGRVAMGRAGPRDVVGLGRSIQRLAMVRATLEATPALAAHAERLRGLEAALVPLGERIGSTCVDSPPGHLREGGLIRDGVDAALDEARLLQRDGGTWLAGFQERVAREHGLTQAKVGFNAVFGYFVELTGAQARESGDALVRGGFHRKQTLKNAERYTNAELSEFEQKVTTAEARAIEREQALFDGLCRTIAGHVGPLAAFAEVVGVVDALLGLADKAHARGWVRPTVVDERVLRIEGGRHPVLDELLAGEFVPNDVEVGDARRPSPELANTKRKRVPAPSLRSVRDDADGADTAEQAHSGASAAESAGAACLAHANSTSPTLALITGPNMAGKSTFIRQVALITLLAHTGSYVPAACATIGLCDRIFTRVGADDALHRGQSTFMVEMTETASILNNATPRSLVILDEIGRGTSTLDGLSLAWAITEHLAELGCRTLFATHYHELTDLEGRLEGRVRNLHVQVKEWPGKDGHPEIVFLHRIMAGRADQSYGVHVARLAGLPRSVTQRATEVLESISVQHAGAAPVASIPQPAPAGGQMHLYTQYMPHPVVEELKALHLDSLTPLAAFDMLRQLAQGARTPG